MPTFIFEQQGSEKGRIQGANAQSLETKLEELCNVNTSSDSVSVPGMVLFYLFN